MSASPVDNALTRMEAALSRIERATQALPAHDSALAARHERLRAAVGESLRELDALLAEPEA